MSTRKNETHRENHRETHGNEEGELLTKDKSKTSEPSLYKVVLINDHYTAQDFVVLILEQVFNKSGADAHRLMMRVHTEGQAIVGTFTKEIAEMKVAIVHHLSRQNEYPLKCVMEPV